ncbi:MAG: phosphatidylinositol mannoside acyltransferase [Acidimicrobiales bacterium]
MAGASLRLYQVGAGLARLVPAPLAAAAGAVIGDAAALAAPERRHQVERNLRRVHGVDFEGRALRRAVRHTFRSYARYYLESFRLPAISRAALVAGMSVPGWEHVQRGLEGGKGVILALPHLGGWEWAGFWVAEEKGVPISVVVEALEPREVFDWFVDLRRSFGMNVIALGPGAGSEVLRALAANHVLCLLSDRDIDGGGVEVEFFGERTTLPAGPATLALRTGAPLLPTAVYYRNGGRHGEVRPPIPIERKGRLREDVARVTQALAHELEALIRDAPDQWHLMQPNWPSDPGFRRP